MASDDEDGLRLERDFMDALRSLKARSGLSYRDIAARMSRTDPRHAMARSTLASLLAGNSLPRRPGQARALIEVLAAELNEPGQTLRFMQAWSRLITARREAELPAAPAPALPAPLVLPAPAARGAASVWMQPPDPPRSATTSPPENPFSGPQLRALFLWLTLLTVIAFVIWAMLPPPGIPFWLVWLANIWPLPLAGLVNWLGQDGRRQRAELSDAPAGYLRTEYRDTEYPDSRPAARPGPVGRWPG
jgi:transcriptional regulator with XRE-family HTH domain